MTKRSKVLRWKAEAKWAEIAMVLLAGRLTLIKKLVHIDRYTTIRCRNLNATYGITDDPIDEQLRWMILAIDPRTILVTALGGNEQEILWMEAEWVNHDAWRAIGTDHGPTKIDEDAESVKLNGVYNWESSGNRSGTWLCAMVIGSTTSSITFTGDLDYDVEYRQITYNNDGSEMSQGPHSLGGA